MLPSSQRLSRQQVAALLANPELKVVFNRIGTLKYTLSNKALTVVTGSKQQKKAVLRNKVRRQIYSVFAAYQLKKPITAIFYVSKQIYDLSFPEIKDLFHALLSKIEKTA